MGVGKSTVGKKLASKMGYSFIDTDKVFETKYKLRINDFFAKYGEVLFRKLEYEVLQTTFNMENCVISTGGGLSCHSDAIKKINENGISVFLEMDENAIYSRLSSSKQKRPLLESLTEDELRETISSRLNQRIPYYKQANIIVSGLSIDIHTLINKIEAFKK